MLHLFKSIFGAQEAQGRYPENLIEQAIERAIDGTDPRLRVVSGHAKRLRQPVVHAIDHVIALVDRLAPPHATRASDYATWPLLRALFVSPQHLHEVFGKDPALSTYREQAVDVQAPVFALLLAEYQEKNTFGLELAGESVQRDVAQITVNFHRHRLLDLCTCESDIRRALKRRAFDHLIALALNRLVEEKNERLELKHQHDLLKAKLITLQQGGWGFEDKATDQPDPASIQREIDEIERQFAGLAINPPMLEHQLDLLADLLNNAERHLWAESVDLHVDAMNIKRKADDSSAQHIRFEQLHNALGQRLAAVLVEIHPDQLPRKESFSATADRVLAELQLPYSRR